MTLAISEAVILDLIGDATTPVAHSLRGITVANGYSYDIGDVVREIPNIPEAVRQFRLPAAFVWPGEERYDPKQSLGRTLTCILDLNIMILERVERDVEACGRRMVYDAMKAVMGLNVGQNRAVSHTTGTINLRVRPTGMLVFNGLVDPNQAGGQLVVELEYRMRLGDPYHVA